MTVNLSVQKLYFTKNEVTARYIGDIGWGLFAETDFAPGDCVCWLNLGKTATSQIMTWTDSFEKYAERSFTVAPDFAWCATHEHPFWYINHSCRANCGFVNWGRAVHGSIPIIAYEAIAAGEQITMDYSLMTPRYDGGPDGRPWEMTPCLCGESNCRGTITDFYRLRTDNQRQAILPNGDLQGRVLAHILLDMPTLVNFLQYGSSLAYLNYLDVLHQQITLSMQFFKATRPKLQTIRASSFQEMRKALLWVEEGV